MVGPRKRVSIANRRKGLHSRNDTNKRGRLRSLPLRDECERLWLLGGGGAEEAYFTTYTTSGLTASGKSAGRPVALSLAKAPGSFAKSARGVNTLPREGHSRRFDDRRHRYGPAGLRGNVAA